MIAEISAGLSSLKAAKDMIQALHGMQTAVAINDVKFALQGHLLDAQQGLFSAQEQQAAATKRIAELEQEIMNLKDWEREKKRYQLRDIGTVGFAYAPKAGMENEEPMHWLCQQCFESGHKSILQFVEVTTTSGGRGMKSTWRCSKCSNAIKAGMSAKPSDPSTW